jgi:hypothetical protein
MLGAEVKGYPPAIWVIVEYNRGINATPLRKYIMAQTPIGPTMQVKYGTTVAVTGGFFEGQLGYVRKLFTENIGRETEFGVQLVNYYLPADAVGGGGIVGVLKADLVRDDTVPPIS